MLREILKLQLGPAEAIPSFSLSPETFEKADSLLFENGIISRKIRMDEIMAQ